MTYEEWSEEMQMYWNVRSMMEHYIETEEMPYRIALDWERLRQQNNRHRERLIRDYPEYYQRSCDED